MTDIVLPRPAWLELNAQRVTVSSAFYRALWAWESRQLHHAPFGALPMLSNGGHVFANEFMAMGAFAPPRWLIWFEGLPERALLRVQALGGRHGDVTQIRGNGNRLDCTDPMGHRFGIIAPEFDLPPHGRCGDPALAALWAPEAAGLAGFYGELFGLETEAAEFGAVMTRDGHPVLLLMNTSVEICPPRWIPYVRSASVTADVERARRLGAVVQVPEHGLGHGLKAAVLDDPGHVAFGIMGKAGD